MARSLLNFGSFNQNHDAHVPWFSYTCFGGDDMIYLSRTPHGVRGLKFKAVIAEGIIETIKRVADELFPPQGK